MIRLLLSISAVSLLGCGGTVAATQFDGEAAYRYVQEQVAFWPRVPGTEAHRRTGDWILAHLTRTADSVEVQAFIHVTESGDSLPMRNFIGRFRPDLPDRILLLAHWDTRPMADQAANLAAQQQPVPGANDGASGVAVLLGVADVLAVTPPAVGVDLLFVDGEDYGDFSGPDALIGSTYYAQSLSPESMPLFAVLFDMVGDADLQIYRRGILCNMPPRSWHGSGRSRGALDTGGRSCRSSATRSRTTTSR